MNKKLIILLLFIVGCHYGFALQLIKATDKRISYTGRITFSGDSSALSWTGNSISINFTGTGVKVLLKDEYGKNYFKRILDGRIMPDLDLDSIKHTYSIATNIKPGKHTLTLFKRTEWQFGKTWFYGLAVEHGQLDAAPAQPKRKIEFYGNSITCGYAVLDTAGKDRGSNEFEDGYLSYAAITARHFNANYSCISKSGIGVMVSWFPLIMPEMYDRLDATEAHSKWDFKRYTPDVVVINLFQNDSWIIKLAKNPQFINRFGLKAPTAFQIVTSYKNFVRSIRNKYPSAQIICVLGNMDATKAGSTWPGYITEAITRIHDKKIKTHFLPYKNTPGHPGKKEQQLMADDLINYIDKNIKW